MNKGEMQKVKFGLFKKTFMFECEDHGLVLERDGKTVCLYATDRNHAKIYCALPLGPEKIFKRLSYMIVAPDDQYMLMLVEGVMVVVDFVNKTCATNVEKLRVFGSDAWGEECSAPWQKEYNKLFGLEMNAAAADAFWNWFAENEESIVFRLNGINSGGQGAAEMINDIDKHLAPVFPYIPAGRLEFELGCNGNIGEFRFFHCGNPNLEEDGRLFGERMPDGLKETWQLIVEA